MAELNSPVQDTQTNKNGNKRVGTPLPTKRKESFHKDEKVNDPNQNGESIESEASNESSPRSTQCNRNIFENELSTPKQTNTKMSLLSAQDTPQQNPSPISVAVVDGQPLSKYHVCIFHIKSD